jgi:hypothetical protein
MRRQAGRPKKTEGIELVTVDDCLQKMAEFLNLPEPPIQRKTLQNKLSRAEYTRYGTYKIPMLDWNEVKKTLHWKKRVS